MPKYRFAVRSPEGKLRTGSVTEASLEDARDRLKKAGFVIVTLAEEAELVIHQAKTTASGAPTAVPERAAIIEFESTFGERIAEFFSRFILRKELAIVLFVLGIGWAGYQIATKPKATPMAEPKYQLFLVEVEIGGSTELGDTYEVMLPDIPFRFTQKVSDGKVAKATFETLKQPGNVQVRLTDAGEVVAQGEGMLSLRKEGVLTGTVTIDPVKKPR